MFEHFIDWIQSAKYCPHNGSYDVLCNVKTFEDCFLAENGKNDVTRGHCCEDTMLVLPSKSKYSQLFFSNLYGAKGITDVNIYVPNARDCADLFQ